MTVVLDCNVFVICLTSRSPYHSIYRALISGRYNLAVTTDILLEYQEVIEAKYGNVTANAFISLLNELPNVHHITTYYQWRLITADADDNKYCDCAVASNADYMVTEDRHFDVVKGIGFPVIRTLSVDEFAGMIEGGAVGF